MDQKPDWCSRCGRVADVLKHDCPERQPHNELQYIIDRLEAYGDDLDEDWGDSSLDPIND